MSTPDRELPSQLQAELFKKHLDKHMEKTGDPSSFDFVPMFTHLRHKELKQDREIDQHLLDSYKDDLSYSP